MGTTLRAPGKGTDPAMGSLPPDTAEQPGVARDLQAQLPSKSHRFGLSSPRAQGSSLGSAKECSQRVHSDCASFLI